MFEVPLEPHIFFITLSSDEKKLMNSEQNSVTDKSLVYTIQDDTLETKNIAESFWCKFARFVYNNGTGDIKKLYDYDLNEKMVLGDKEENIFDVVVEQSDDLDVWLIFEKMKRYFLKKKKIDDKDDKEGKEESVEFILPVEVCDSIRGEFTKGGKYCLLMSHAKQDSYKHNTMYIYTLKKDDTKKEDTYKQLGSWALMDEDKIVALDDEEKKKENTSYFLAW